MTAILVFLGFLVFLGVALFALDSMKRAHTAKVAELAAQYHDLRSLLTSIDHEARAQLSAGDPNFDYLVRLLDDSRKELPR